MRTQFSRYPLALIVALALALALVGSARGPQAGVATATELQGWSAAPLAAPLTGTSLSFFAITPCRVADTRGNGFTGAFGAPSLFGNGSQRSFPIGGQCGIPASAAAASFNFTVTNVSTLGDLRVFPGGTAAPNASTLNWQAGWSAIANAASIPLNLTTSYGNAINVQLDGPGSVDLIIDVNGYYASNATITIVGSTAVIAPGNFDVLIVSCPSGYHAVGGGVDPENVLTMVVTGSAPMIGGTRTLSSPNGQGGQADGWQGSVRNNATVPYFFKVAVICAP